ncbi:MAG: hypothetical protein NZ932_02760 [Candidatus Bathyarchaeota archaeon]|nr:hypothetical protein [Candidatus Bathyarchaeota archaeon]MDW8041152.1 hypothetical protein [Nitrososphaerota archaeon]
MKPLETLYWLRFVLGIVAAFFCIGYGLATNTISAEPNINVFTNGMALAIIVYVLSYYMIKPKFIWKVDKPQKIATTGIGIYILSWLVFWALLYTILITGT